MHPAIVRHLTLPLHERLRGRATMARFRALRRGDRLRQGCSPIGDAAETKLRALVDHCLREVPFHRRRLLEAGIERGADLTAERWGRLPALEREEIREHGDDLQARSWRGRLIRYSTGGSTGRPLVFQTDRHKETCHNAQKLRFRAWHGIEPGDRQVDFWGAPIELDQRTRLRAGKDRWLLNQTLLSAFDLTTERLAAHARTLRQFRPRLIYGYPTVIDRMAGFIASDPAALGDWRPWRVVCTSEMLHDHQRARIRQAFGCPVVNEYGARDAGLIAHECPAGRLHIAAEHVRVEVDAPDEHGVGDLLVTNLDGLGMPFLRYRLGDRGRLDDGACGCGSRLPLLAELAGRSNDFLIGAGGRRIHSLAPVYVLRELAQVRQFKLTQRPDLSIEVELVAAEPLDEAECARVRGRLQQIIGFQTPVSFRFPPVIAPERSGKYRSVVCEAV